MHCLLDKFVAEMVYNFNVALSANHMCHVQTGIKDPSRQSNTVNPEIRSNTDIAQPISQSMLATAAEAGSSVPVFCNLVNATPGNYFMGLYASSAHHCYHECTYFNRDQREKHRQYSVYAEDFSMLRLYHWSADNISCLPAASHAPVIHLCKVRPQRESDDLVF